MMSRYAFLVNALTLMLLIAFSSPSEIDGGDGGDPPEPVSHPDLPDFAEGVSVSVLSQLESCIRAVVPGQGNWLELEYVAMQMSDDGERLEEFDSTVSRGRPLLLAGDDDAKFPGLSEGLRQVCVGEKREITIQAGSPLMKVDPKSGLKQPKMDRAAVYEVTVRSIQDQRPSNLFTKIDADNNREISREELKTYFEKHGPVEIQKDNLMDQVIEGFMHTNDLDLNDRISEAEFPGKWHQEL